MSLVSFIVALAVFPLVVSAEPWYAVFWNSTLKTDLFNTYESTTPLSSNDASFSVTAYDHTTIAFNPSADLIATYTPKLGQIQSAHVLAYAHDENGQAILLNYDGPNAIPTLNSFPHTTISYSNKGNYSAVYSNDLWARVNASGYVDITFVNGFPAAIQFTNTTTNNVTQTFPLPAIQLGANTYAATTVLVRIIDPANQPQYTGTFCVNSWWNKNPKDVCAAPSTNATTTPPTSGPNTTLAPTATPNTTLAPTNGTTPAPTNGTTPAPNDAALLSVHGMSMMVAAIIMMLAFL